MGEAETGLRKQVGPSITIAVVIATVALIPAVWLGATRLSRARAVQRAGRRHPPRSEQWVRANNLAARINVAGNAYAGHERYDSALSCYRDVLRIAAKYDLPDRAAASYLDIGGVYVHLDEPESAKLYYHRSDSVLRAIGKPSLRGGSTLNEGTYRFSMLGDLDSAEKLLKSGLLTSRRNGNQWDEALAVQNLGSLHGAREQYDSAAYYFRLALDLARHLKDLNGEAEALDDLGLVWANRGRLDSALPFFVQAVEVAHNAGSTGAEARALADAGACRYRLGDAVLAEENLKQALEMYKSLGDGPGVGLCKFYLESARDARRWLKPSGPPGNARLHGQGP